MQHSVRRSAKWPVTSLLVALAAALLTGCGVGDDMMATMQTPTSREAPAGTDARVSAGHPVLATPPPQMGAQPDDLSVTAKQQAYLDAVHAAGIRPSDDLLALSIGSYVCQARAAKQSDDAVWDFVMPLVRSDLQETRASAGAPAAAEVNAVTADYVRIATERLC